MLEFLQANWIWLLVGAGVLWFLFRQGGHGMGGHGSHGSESTRRTTASDDGQAGHGEEQSARSTTRRSGRGCC
ncbi:MAG: hypothetical protein A3G94_03870 [Deltaproteobacteria bacterium RIFCSPLOWO2_12_FULL_60_16]|nr:MAG: hypothetical protein A3G94_03870 [Deltaproteobacteria bacterium RIFCSPLOWO2_12_FULL_60_16]